MQQLEHIKVAIRFRPLNKREINDLNSELIIDEKQSIVNISNENNIQQQFIFDNVFNSYTSQEFIFDTIAKNNINWVIQGYNSSIFTYGPTSSGKTFTMFGTKDDLGIIPRTCEYIFNNLKNEYSVKCSFLEIYKEKIRDLLDNKKDKNDLKLRQHVTKGIYVQGIKEKLVYNSEDILSSINEGMSQRVVSSTALNNVSSRSHAILTITISQILSDGSEMISKLNMVDLAGSENVSKSEVQGINLLEAQSINKSLSALGNVIYALTEKGREHIPYRDSKLTYLLQDSLGGNSKTTIIGTASPAKSSYYETIETLRFIKRAKNIDNIPKVNKNESIDSLLKTIETLNKKIVELEEKCKDTQVEILDNGKCECKQLKIYKTRCERLEKTISTLNIEIDKEYTRTKKLRDMLDKQRDLSYKLSKDLYREKIKGFSILNELSQYQNLYNTLKNSPLELYPVIISKTKIHNITLSEDEDL
jgi:kinesin family protein 5